MSDDFKRICEPKVGKAIAYLDQIERSAKSNKADKDAVADLILPLLERVSALIGGLPDSVAEVMPQPQSLVLEFTPPRPDCPNAVARWVHDLDDDMLRAVAAHCASEATERLITRKETT